MIRTSAIVSDGTYPCGTAILQGSMKDVFRKAKEAGYDCIQLTIRSPEDYDTGELTALIRQYNLPVSAMATGRIYTVDGFSMGSGCEENRAKCIRRMCQLADLSFSLGKPALVIGAVRGRIADASTEEEYMQQFHRSMRELLAYCEPLGIPVILEADDHLEADIFCDPADTLRYVKSFHSPVLHMYLDTMHLYNERLDPAETIRAFGSQIFSIDISGEDRKAPMDSAMDFSAIAAAIKESGFDGVLTFEMPPSPPENSAAESLAYIRKLLEH